jgi:hypothetical protein
MEPSELSFITDESLSKIMKLASGASKSLEALIATPQGLRLIEEVRNDFSTASNKAMFFNHVSFIVLYCSLLM